MREYKYNIPIYKKYGLTIEEAAEFSCIGAGILYPKTKTLTSFYTKAHRL